MEFRDLKKQYKMYEKEIDQSIKNVLLSANYIGGKEVSELELRLAEYVGVKHCITCANGTEAMTLVLMAWGIGKGHAVFVPDFTFFSTGEVVSFLGATPIFVDVDPVTYNMNPEELKKAIVRVNSEGVLTPKVIIPVDLFGLPADFDHIDIIAKEHNLLILEDAAQGFGGSIRGRKACSFGDAATTSFFPAKPLGCYGDGGAIFTNDSDLFELVTSLKVHGKGEDKYDNVRVGVNSRLDTIQAAILNVKLTAFIEHELEEVNNVNKWYTSRLKDVVKVPEIPVDFVSSFAQYTIQLKTQGERDMLQSKLKEKGIPSMIYYMKPMHKQGAFSELHSYEEKFPVTEELCNTVLSLPMHPYMSEADVEVVCEEIKVMLDYEK